jgi:hypothetical protein
MSRRVESCLQIKITQAQWEEFVRQKTSEEAPALSQRNRELALSNIHKVHLGPVDTKGSSRSGGLKERRQ